MKFLSNPRYMYCTDPFREVKSKREKKKEVLIFLHPFLNG